jgi:hypothetical protein
MVSQAAGPISREDASPRIEWRKLRQSAFAAAWVETTGALSRGVQSRRRTKTASGRLGRTLAVRRPNVSVRCPSLQRDYNETSYLPQERNFIDLLAAAAGKGVDVRILTGAADG